MKFLGFAHLCALVLGATACGNTAIEESRAVPVEETGVSTAAATATRIYAYEPTDTHQLSFETLGTFETRNGRRVLVIRGTTNRYLKDVFSFVPDDAFGTASIISERRFEVVLEEGHELNTMLSGMPLFVSIDTFTGAPTRYYAQLVLSPRFFDFRGPNSIAVHENVDPVYVRNAAGTDNLMYRGRVDSAATSLTVTGPDGTPVVTRVDAGTFQLDWRYPAVYQAVDPHTDPLTFTATLNSGAVASKTARLVVRVTGLAISTHNDPYITWPTPACQPPVYHCIHAQPAGTLDFGACGTHRQVQRCMLASACEVLPGQPLSLTEIAFPPPGHARQTPGSGASATTWYGLVGIDAYSTPECPATPVSIQAVVDHLHETTQTVPPSDWGEVTDRAGMVVDNYFFGSSSSPLLGVIDAFAGGGPIQAWFAWEELPCHNCHSYAEYGALYYPNSGKVIMLKSYHGYDW
ncbi:hypothetical protein [Comamonas sp. JC664]|uniref:hypothetical protein n=1 Tax=Comamonas sp. JC664 TaxID=2801917 RepID=UPI0017490934|nr:hypothetical protein [Comamonas sp. JC664]MBL0698541.1 hypothetical protein [Comamonas sp. JC664]GHH00374.1 hypothetical protein GCM10012319_67450 [Comamonas sp. KCTC 72670]